VKAAEGSISAAFVITAINATIRSTQPETAFSL